MDQNILFVAQIILSLLAIVLVLVQVKGTGFGRVWGSSASFTRRGLEKLVFKATFVVVILFIVVSALTLIV